MVVFFFRRSLEFDAAALQFRVNDPPFYPIIRNLTLTNLFQYPVVIYSAKLSSKVQSWFSVSTLYIYTVILNDFTLTCTVTNVYVHVFFSCTLAILSLLLSLLL